MKLHARASSNSVIKMIMSNANGIGESKRESKAQSDLVGQNGQSVSSKAHSISSTQNLRTVTTQYTNFIKDNYGGRVVKNMNSETIKEFIRYKIEEDKLSLSSANTYISELGKISDNLNQLGVNSTLREEITNYRTELKESYGSLQSKKVDRTNSNPVAIIKEMNNTSPFGLSSQLQLEAGLRVGDATDMSKISINNDNSLTIHGSKNGLTYTTAPISNNLRDRVAEAKENGYKVAYSEYRESLKEATETTNQEYKGTHSLRYDFANHAHSENLKNGISSEDSKLEISLKMGHSREEITEHYLKSNK